MHAREYIIAHGFVRTAIADYTNQNPATVPITKDPCTACRKPHGRPRTLGAHVSWTHTNNLVLVAVADHPVGIDAEHITGTITDIITALHPTEQAEIAAYPHQKIQRAAQAWVRKEAHLKLLGVGLNRDPSLDYVGTGHKKPSWIHDLYVPSGYAAALAVPAEKTFENGVSVDRRADSATFLK